MATSSSRRQRVAGLKIERWAHGGDGVALPSDGPLAGRVVFVSGGVVPGDTVAGRLVKKKARWARVQLDAIDVPSPERVEPPCAHQAACGGCPWMVGAPSAQRASRTAILFGEARKHLRWTADEAERLIEMAPDTSAAGYRHKVRLSFERRDGRVTLGYRARRGHAIIDVAECVVAHPTINAALPGVRDRLADVPLAAGEVHLVAGDRSVAVVIAGPGHRTVVGEDATTLAFGGLPLRVEADQFVQANPAVINDIIARVEGWARECQPGVAVELFAGGGTLTPGLWRAGHTVSAFELDARGRASFRTRARSFGACGEASELYGCDLFAVGVPLPAPPRPRLVLLDPPRAGAAPLLPWLRACGAERIIYISCDVATAMRDLAGLTEAGSYSVVELVGFDVAPHTGHQELAVLLARRASAAD